MNRTFICGSKELGISNRGAQNWCSGWRFRRNLALYHLLSIMMNGEDNASGGSLLFSNGVLCIHGDMFNTPPKHDLGNVAVL